MHTFREQAAVAVGQVLAQEPSVAKIVVSEEGQARCSVMHICEVWCITPYLSMSSMRSPLARLSSSGLLAVKSWTTRRMLPATALLVPFLEEAIVAQRWPCDLVVNAGCSAAAHMLVGRVWIRAMIDYRSTAVS